MLAKRYLVQMIGELKTLPRPDGAAGTLNGCARSRRSPPGQQNMVLDLARAAGIVPNSFTSISNRVGNTSSASILLAIHDAVGGTNRSADAGFRAGFGAGAVGGYVVMRVDPAIVHATLRRGLLLWQTMEIMAKQRNHGVGSLIGKVALGDRLWTRHWARDRFGTRPAWRNIALNYRSEPRTLRAPAPKFGNWAWSAPWSR